VIYKYFERVENDDGSLEDILAGCVRDCLNTKEEMKNSHYYSSY